MNNIIYNKIGEILGGFVIALTIILGMFVMSAYAFSFNYRQNTITPPYNYIPGAAHLNWNPVQGAYRYQIEFGHKRARVQESWPTTPGAWLNYHYFQYQVLAQPVVTLLRNYSGVVSFGWNWITGANEYQIELTSCSYNRWANAPMNYYVTTNSFTSPELPRGQSYRIRVRAMDAYGDFGPWSLYRYFRL